jgi:hypothetical protein
LVVVNGRAEDTNSTYLRYLEETARTARTTGAVIIVPTPDDSVRINQDYARLLRDNADVFIPGAFHATSDSYDSVVRRFPWIRRTEGETAGPVLSVGLLAALYHGHPVEKAEELGREAVALAAGEYTQDSNLPKYFTEAITPSAKKTSSRILFRILPFELVKKNFGRGNNWLLSEGILWAPELIRNEHGEGSDLKGKVVIIGSDFKRNDDSHTTAFGSMSGSYIVANTVNMFLKEMFIRESAVINTAVLVFLGIVFCIFYTVYPHIIVTFILTIATIVFSIASVAIFNRYGIFFNVWIPLLGLGLYNTISDIPQLVKYMLRFKLRLGTQIMRKLV